MNINDIVEMLGETVYYTEDVMTCINNAIADAKTFIDENDRNNTLLLLDIIKNFVNIAKNDRL